MRFYGNKTFTCRICSETGPLYEEYEAAGACGECVKRLGNMFLRAHSEGPIIEFSSDAEWAQFQAEEQARRESSRLKKPIKQALRMKVFERDGFKCKHCGVQKDLQADHVVPESKGGPTTFDNLQTLCRSCNRLKGAKHDAGAQ